MQLQRIVRNSSLALLIGGFFSSSALHASESMEGVYVGAMQLSDGFERVIPLSISLSFTGQVTTAPNGEERQVIDGAFLVDEEGGPYAFSVVSFDIDKSRLDLRYNRPQFNLSPEIPSSFRLIGTLQADGSIQGKVSSGSRGIIGSFTLSRSEQPSLAARKKYQGTWEGEAVLAGGRRTPYRIVMVDGLSAYTNPPDYELDFTPGKVSYVKWNNTKFDINSVAIDYLRRKVTLFKQVSTGSPGLSIEFQMEEDGQIVRGEIYSVFRGKTAEFELQRVQETTPHGGELPSLIEWKKITLADELAVTHGSLPTSPTYTLDSTIDTQMIKIIVGGPHCTATPRAVWVYEDDSILAKPLRALGAGVFDNHYFDQRFSFRRIKVGFEQRLTTESNCEVVLGIAPSKEFPRPNGPYIPSNH